MKLSQLIRTLTILLYLRFNENIAAVINNFVNYTDTQIFHIHTICLKRHNSLHGIAKLASEQNIPSSDGSFMKLFKTYYKTHRLLCLSEKHGSAKCCSMAGELYILS